MKKRTPAATLKILASVCVMSILLAIAVPVVLGRFPALRAIHAQGVVAAARDMHVVTQPAPIGPTGNFVLGEGAIYASEVPTGKAPHVARMALIDATISAGPSQKVAADSRPAPVVEALARVGFDMLFVRRATVHLTEARRPGDTLTEVSAVVTATRGGIVKLKGKFNFRGERLRFEATVNTAGSGRSGGQFPVNVVISGRGLKADFNGFVGLDANLDVRGELGLVIADARKFIGWLGMPVAPGPGLGGLTVNGRVNWSGREIAYSNAVITLDGNRAKGTLSVNLASARPALVATLALDRLDLSPYFTGIAANEPDAAGGIEAVARLLRLFEADVRLSAASVTGPLGRLGRGAVAIALKDGRLHADIAELEHEGGTLGGILKVDLSTVVPHVVARGKITALELSRVAARVGSRPLIQGVSSASFDIAGTGSSIAELTRSLYGRIGISMPEGGRLGIDLPALATAVSDGRGEVRGWDKAGRGATPFQEGEIRLRLEAGVARAESVRLKSGGAEHLASGTFNYLADYMDVTVALAEVQAKLAGHRILRLLGSIEAPRARAEPPLGDPDLASGAGRGG